MDRFSHIAKWRSRKILRRVGLVATFSVLLSGCSEKGLELSLGGGNSIAGTVPMFSTVSASGVVGALTAGCASGRASLHRVADDGSIESTELLSADVAADGSFKLPNARSKGVTLDLATVRYVIKAAGCGSIFYRPLTENVDQTVTGGSTLLTLTADVADGSKRPLSQIEKQPLKDALLQLDSLSASDLTDLLNQIIASASLSQVFQDLTNLDPRKLQELPPREWTLTAPSTLLESTATAYSVNINHWNQDYTAAYEWRLDGSVVSTSSTWTASVDKNSQGPRSLVLTVGADDGSGAIDTAKPVKSIQIPLVIANNHPAVAPAISWVGAEIRNDPSGSVLIDTGALQANCSTFSDLALTESPFVPPLLSSDFTISCTQAGTQTEAFVLSAADGTKTLALWARDQAGNISTAASTDTVTLDRTNPSLTLATLGALKGGANASIVFAAADATAGLQEVTLEYAADGTTFSEIADLTTQASPWSWSVPVEDLSGAKLRLSAIDRAGNTSQILSNAFAIDSTAPALSATSSSRNTNTNSVSFSGSCEIGLAVLVTGAESATTSCVSGSWSYATSKTSDGLYNYTFTQTDAAGNAATTATTWRRDTVSPTANLTYPVGGELLKGGEIRTITWSASDSNFSATPISLEYSLNSGSNWVSLATGLANTGSYDWTVPNFNNSTVRVRVKATDQAGNVTPAATPANFTVDSSPPTLLLTSLTGGQLLKGGSTVNITWSASDAHFGSTPIKLELSQDGGTTYSVISGASALANSGTFSWTVPALDGAAFRIRATATDSVGLSSTAASTANFAIDSTLPSVTLTSLTGGQTVPGNGAQTAITWSASDANPGDQPVAIEFSDDSGSSWTALAANLANSGTWSWTINIPDGNTYRVRISFTDGAGNIRRVTSTSNFSVASSAPILTQTLIPTIPLTNSLTSFTFGGACEVGLTITVKDGGGTSIDTIPCASGSWSWVSPAQTTDGEHGYTFSQTNIALLTTEVSGSWIRDTQAPEVTAVSINGGAAYAVSATLGVAVTASDNRVGGLKVRIRQANSITQSCQSEYADDGWETQNSATQSYSMLVSTSDGTKKVCAWAKDGAGNISEISPVAGNAGVDMDTIDFSAGNIPQVTALAVVNASGGANDGTNQYASGETVKVSWTLTDTEGLSSHPVDLWVTTNNTTWTPVLTDFAGNISGSNPTSWSYDYYWTAPTSSYFRLKIMAKDRAGNTSPPVVSGAQNTGNWSVFAGTTDRGVGSNARSAVFRKNDGVRQGFAFHPKTGDLYIADDDAAGGLKKVDSQTGLVSVVIPWGTMNLPTDGFLNSSHRLNTTMNLTFDSKGRLYYMRGDASRVNSAEVYQINLETGAVRRYLGALGNTVYDNTATPATVYVANSGFTFDESDTMYFFTSCMPGGVWNSATLATRMMKVTQNSDGTAGTVGIVAGDCTKGTPVSGSVATATPLTNHGDSIFWTIAVWDHGNVIYATTSATTPIKILNGTIYSTTMTGGSIGGYSAVDGKIYTISSNRIFEYTPSLTGAGGDTQNSILVNSGGTGACNEDGVSASATCMGLFGFLTRGPQGRIFFGSGSVNAPMRVRYVDDTGLIKTYAGVNPFDGHGKHRSLLRGTFGGIYYKQIGEPNQTGFPSQLYFTEVTGMVFGAIDASGIASVLGGDQTGRAINLYGTGTSLNTQMSLGASASLAGHGLGFDAQGLPWIKYLTSSGANIASLDADRKFIVRQSGGTGWDYVATNINPLNTVASSYGGYANLTLKGESLFFFGRTYSPPSATETSPVLRLFDFNAATISHLMGGTGVTPTEDSTAPGSLENASIDGYCYNTNCAVQFVEGDPNTTDDDAFYFTENTKLRKILQPTVPANHELVTVFTASGAIQNFILSMDSSQVFYTRSGGLYCRALTSAGIRSWCNDSRLGPSTGLAGITKGPNQLTWKDATTLLVNNYTGEIYQFNLPSDP